jgi:hypothetical protein
VRKACQQFSGPIDRAVIDDDDFIERNGLPQRAVDRLMHKIGVVVIIDQAGGLRRFSNDQAVMNLDALKRCRLSIRSASYPRHRPADLQDLSEKSSRQVNSKHQNVWVEIRERGKLYAMAQKNPAGKRAIEAQGSDATEKVRLPKPLGCGGPGVQRLGLPVAETSLYRGNCDAR